MYYTHNVFIFKLQLKADSDNGSGSSASSTTASPSQDDTDEPPMKKFCHLSRLLEEKWKEGVKKASRQPAWEAEMERYMKAVHRVQQHDDAVTFWTNEDMMRNYPLLSVVVVDLLIIPGSSAPVERTFSTAGDASSGKRNRLSDTNLERYIFERTNSIF